ASSRLRPNGCGRPSASGRRRLRSPATDRRSLAPTHSVGAGGFGQAFQVELAAIVEPERLADAKLPNAHRHGNVARGRGRAEPGSELDRCAEQVVVVVGNRLAGADSDAQVQ